MRSFLFAVGAFLFLAYPVFLLFAIVSTLDQSQKKPDAAAINLTARSANDWLEHDFGPRRSNVLRNTTIRNSGN